MEQDEVDTDEEAPGPVVAELEEEPHDPLRECRGDRQLKGSKDKTPRPWHNQDKDDSQPVRLNSAREERDQTAQSDTWTRYSQVNTAKYDRQGSRNTPRAKCRGDDSDDFLSPAA